MFYVVGFLRFWQFPPALDNCQDWSFFWNDRILHWDLGEACVPSHQPSTNMRCFVCFPVSPLWWPLRFERWCLHNSWHSFLVGPHSHRWGHTFAELKSRAHLLPFVGFWLGIYFQNQGCLHWAGSIDKGGDTCTCPTQHGFCYCSLPATAFQTLPPARLAQQHSTAQPSPVLSLHRTSVPLLRKSEASPAQPAIGKHQSHSTWLSPVTSKQSSL